MGKIESDLKDALRARDGLRLSVLRMLKSAIGYALIEKKLPAADDAIVTATIQKQIKQRRDSIAAFEQGGRADQAAKERAELAILEGYLPKQLSDAELAALVDAAIAAVGAKSKADFGKVMKEVMAKAAGQADGKRVSAAVADKLA